ncbi:MAG: hypothetical protein M3Z41_01415 [Candidatus Eremiobacteraeota bacterium]|nr:hypothetical protein [Candidatus Eremiobacteraeota bacterium]
MPADPRLPISRALVAIVLALCMAGCAHRQTVGGNGLPGNVSGNTVGYVDMDAVIAAHPLHSQLQAMQDQIGVLQQEAAVVPTGMSPPQAAAYGAMQRELGSASDRFQQDLAQRRAYYERREAEAINRLQASALGTGPGSSGVLSGLQQQYGQQAQALQKQAFATLNNYRTELFRQDGEHLKAVQQLLAADMRNKLKQRESAASSAETKYQIDLVKEDQEQRLNLQAKLQNLALSDADRKQYQDQLQAISQREQTKINALKARDNADLMKLQRDLNVQAASKYDAERTSTQAATQAKLAARQREMQTAMAPQLQALSGKFQQQLNDANTRLAGNEKYKAQAQSVHDQMQSGYMAEASKAESSYRDIRAALIAKYSTIAHLQFQDNEAIAAQANKIAADRRDLYQKIADQVRTQVTQIAQKEGIAVVFGSTRAAGSAVNLTDRVTKAINSMQGATSLPATSASGGP